MAWTDPDPIGDHIRLVETVEAAGGVPAPEEWRALLGRLQSFQQLADQTPLRDRLAAAVINGDDDVPTIRCLALAEDANQMQVQTVTGYVTNAVFKRLAEIYSAHARDAYSQVAAKFDKAAKLFVVAASTVDVEADPAVMVQADDKPRKCWLDSESHANALSRLLPAMCAAAALAGVPDAETDSASMPLVADLTDCHVRRAWESWVREGGRCGRWAALLKVGAVLRACPIGEYPGAYAEPRPLEHRKVQIARGEYRTEIHDPEDSDYKPAPIDPKRGGRVVFT